jgi:nitroreductase
MTLIEAIKQRRSVRSYTGEALHRDDAEQVLNSLSTLVPQAPFGASVRIQLISTHPAAADHQPVKLGTYGFVSGASDYLALVYKDEGRLAGESAAYVFEQLLLFCTTLGLGTCWLGGSFSRKDFKSQIQLGPGERLRIVSPVGYGSSRRRIMEFIQGAERHHASRKPFGSLFFHQRFSVPLTQAEAGVYAQPLEMVRLAPSANNGQSWRVVVDTTHQQLHFYATPAYGFSDIDMGIALCHFEQTCRELHLPGRFEVLDLPPEKRAKYTISWITH